MNSIVETSFYPQVLKEFNYPFGNVFIFDKFVLSEIDEGIDFGWDNGRTIIQDVFGFLGTSNGATVNFISNRVNSYSVIATDWIKFFNNNYLLKSYIVVFDKSRFSNLEIEKLFFKGNIKHFTALDIAVNFVENDMVEMI
ncbi:hypothetical protein [Algibacter pacificus]|uniref:hypothetical protein n=1 Tax=Algibacter pacificus TaxID=2599389 RepID=UPI0011CC7093|nr:hypothetical protein [Algibacter pacificus]